MDGADSERRRAGRRAQDVPDWKHGSSAGKTRMEDSEYYAMMRRQYSNTAGTKINKTSKKKAGMGNVEPACQTPGTFSELSKKYGHEDAEMFMERNTEDFI